MDLLDKVIAVAIGCFVAAALLPSAITMLFGANTTTWSTDAVTLWNISPLMVVVAFVLAIVYVARGRGR